MKQLALAVILGMLSAIPAHAAAPAAVKPVEKNAKCLPATTVVVEVRGVALRVPRTAAWHVLLDDGKTKLGLGRPAGDYTCDTPVIKNARGLETINLRIGITGGMNGSEKHFNALRSAMQSAPGLRGSTVQRLPSGIQKITAPLLASELFSLPVDAAPTYDQVPVVFSCENSEDPELSKILPHLCVAAYLHPSGLPIVYSVSRADVPNDDFLAADKARRKQLEDMIDGAKAEKP